MWPKFFIGNSETEWTDRSWTAFSIIVLAVIYYASSKLGFLMAAQVEQVTIIWPPSGIAVAAVLMFGKRIWPGIWIGAFLTNATAHEPVLTAFAIAVGNTFEALIGAWLLQRFTHFNNAMSRIKDIIGMAIFSALFSTMISATIGVISLCISHVQPWSAFSSLWFMWWLGDATGILLFAPPLLIWGNRTPVLKNRYLECGSLLILVTITSALIFTGFLSFNLMPAHGLVYLVFPLIIWAAVRFGLHITTLVTLITSLIATLATVNNLGPFTTATTDQSLALLQIFLTVMLMTGLIVSAAISERKQSEKESRQLAAILASSDDAIIGEDLNGIINFWNTGAERLFGYRPEETIGKSVSLLIPPERSQEESIFLQRLQQGERIKSYETVRQTKDGRRLNISLTLSPVFDDDGKLIGASKISRDITELKRVEAALKKSDRYKDEFLAILAHELRNPLAPLSNALQTLRASKTSPARNAEAYEIMQNQLNQVVHLVDDLIDISRISHGKVELRRKVIRLHDIVTQALETAKPLINSKRHSLSVNVPDEPIWINGDATRLSQVFANLLHNAAKYTGTGGHIWFEAEADENYITVKIRDTGIGIAQDFMPHIFDMFKQANQSVERTTGGLGIGLTLVKKFVDMHEGEISVQSRGIGCGSEFTIRVPRAKAPVQLAEQQQAEEKHINGRKLRVLIVDDHQSLAQTLGWMVEMLGHEFQLAYNGLGALAAAESFHPDIILLDIGLSGMSGYEVCQRLRAHPAFKKCVIVAQTGWSQPEHRERSKAAGFDHHFVKPVPLETLEKLFTSL